MLKSIPVKPLKEHYEGKWIHYDTVVSDFIERLHSRLTVFAILLSIAILSIYLHGEPISCVLPAEFDKINGWREYVHSYCLVRGTYRFENHFDHDVPDASKYVSYYQWVPLFLAFQMACFAFPTIAWAWMQNSFGLGIEYIITALQNAIKEPKANKQNAIIHQNSLWIYCYFHYRTKNKKGWFSTLWQFPSLFMTSYCAYKGIILLNVVSQFFILCSFVNGSPLWGFHELGKAFESKFPSLQNARSSGIYPTETNFPKEVRCHFSNLFHNGVFQIHNVQCLLTINYLHEKLFLALYFWYLLLAFITLISIANFTFSWVTKRFKKELVSRILMTENNTFSKRQFEENAKKFVNDFLGSDGILLFHFIRGCVGSAMSSFLLNKVWDEYNKGLGINSAEKQEIEDKNIDTKEL